MGPDAAQVCFDTAWREVQDFWYILSRSTTSEGVIQHSFSVRQSRWSAFLHWQKLPERSQHADKLVVILTFAKAFSLYIILYIVRVVARNIFDFFIVAVSVTGPSAKLF